MMNRGFLIVLAWIAAACCMPHAWAEARTCAKVDVIEAETVVARITSWSQLYQLYGRYAHCDDGAIAEGFSESVGLLLAERWQDFLQFEALQKSDSAFRQFVIRHIDETMPAERLTRIAMNAVSHCPQKSFALCREIVLATSYTEPGAVQIQHSYVPSAGFVPDAATATTIAEAILSPIYGKDAIDRQKPFLVSLENDVWTVSGQRQKQANRLVVGGVFRIQISKPNARVKYLTHGK